MPNPLKQAVWLLSSDASRSNCFSDERNHCTLKMSLGFRKVEFNMNPSLLLNRSLAQLIMYGQIIKGNEISTF